MGERSAYAPGTFCWADVAGTDLEAQQRFYEQLLGWRAEVTPGGYWMLTLDGRSVAGMFEPPHEMPVPSWFSYVSVEDADATAARARDLGATVQIRPRDLGPPGVQVGRMAMIIDPQGAAVALWQPGLHIGAQLVNDTGAMCWNVLSTSDVDAAASFYGELFGWTLEPLEALGEYWEIRTGAGGLNGGMTALPEDGLPPHWQVIFTVPDAQDAVRRAAALGGGEIAPPATTAIGDFAVVHDPAGASFAVFAGETDD